MFRLSRRAVICAASAVLLGHSHAVQAQTGPVAAYAFEEGSGTTTADGSGNGRTGTLSNATWSANGHSGRALSFNGSTSWVSVPDAAALDLTTAVTVEAWVFATSSSGS